MIPATTKGAVLRCGAAGPRRVTRGKRRQGRLVAANVASRKPSQPKKKPTDLWSSRFLYSDLDEAVTDSAEFCVLPPPWEVELAPVFDKDANEPEFLQAVTETLQSVGPLLRDDPKRVETFRRMVEPERVIIFRVPWVDDDGRKRVNRGFRVQMNQARGPYKGGLRFHPTVNLSILKFLAFEQTFKNALTGLPLGSGKGGADFDPKGKSDGEIMRFCQSFMTELYRHVGPTVDVPAGDIGVGGKEIGYMFGQYKRIVGSFDGGVLTGKGMSYGGSNIRPEATGYGLVYFLSEMVQRKDVAPSLAGLRCAISGSGNVSQFAAEKLLSFGAIPQTFSDSDGTLYKETGFDEADLAVVCHHKNEKRGRLRELEGHAEGWEYFEGMRPWQVGKGYDVALPCATQNEVSLEDALALVQKGVMVVAEGANMPSTPEAVEEFERSGVLFGPAKAANAGGVAVSGLEMAQNAMGIQWTREEVEERLRKIMVDIYDKCDEGSKMVEDGSLRIGADISGFLTVAQAMEEQGHV